MSEDPKPYVPASPSGIHFDFIGLEMRWAIYQVSHSQQMDAIGLILANMSMEVAAACQSQNVRPHEAFELLLGRARIAFDVQLQRITMARMMQPPRMA